MGFPARYVAVVYRLETSDEQESEVWSCTCNEPWYFVSSSQTNIGKY